jgi:carbamoyltransferase
MKDRLNALKRRDWYRPVAPVVAAKAVRKMFAEPEASMMLKGDMDSDEAMGFAPRLNPEVEDMFPAVWHFDGTARPQVVTPSSEPWLHALLKAVALATDLPGVLVNTSFNVRGAPIVNRASDALAILDEEPQLDCLVINDWLFRKQGYAMLARPRSLSLCECYTSIQ